MQEKRKVPQHIAIIMDGNGRWAKARNLPRIMGHHAGVKTVERIVRAAKDEGVSHLSLYAFSTENWKRPRSEVKGLMGLFRYYVRGKVKTMIGEGARLRFAGLLRELPEDIRSMLAWAERETAQGTDIDLIVCLNYGGRQEVMQAVNSLLEEGKRPPITEQDIADRLFLPDLPDPDLLIRTSGEYRLSNFWLWQSSYSEFYFTEKFWPDFSAQDLHEAINEYIRRDRRYGGTGTS
ncbi:MAG: di-trans,poly-cis-decaprenylcistransferase [Synergistales bacterium]|nr:di-trans,poly-cis-decaprenylcistransferase [Synergistales bacterium]